MANNFTPLEYDRDWNSSIDFPTYQDDETKVRADMQYLFDFIKDYINGTGAGDGLLEEIAKAVASAVSGSIPDGSITTKHFATDAVAPKAGALSPGQNVKVASSDGSNPGSPVGFDGTAAVTLLLPAIITAALRGNADTATKLKTARKIGGADFDGSAPITLANIGAAPAGHDHDGRYYTEGEADELFAPAVHDHDDRYYTEAETDNRLSGKADLVGGRVKASQSESAIVAITGNTTLTATHAGKCLMVSSASGVTITVPDDSSIPVGTEVELYHHGAGGLTVKSVSAIYLAFDGERTAGRSLTVPQYGIIGLKKMDGSTWKVSGEAE